MTLVCLASYGRAVVVESTHIHLNRHQQYIDNLWRSSSPSGSSHQSAGGSFWSFFRFLLVFFFAFPSAVMPRRIFMHRHGENACFRVKTRVPEPFWKIGRSIFCTGAVKTNFLHRRGGFVKSCKSIAPVVENTPL